MASSEVIEVMTREHVGYDSMGLDSDHIERNIERNVGVDRHM